MELVGFGEISSWYWQKYRVDDSYWKGKLKQDFEQPNMVRTWQEVRLG
jgi:hypothetical protein